MKLVIWLLWRNQGEDDNDVAGAYTTKELATGHMELNYRRRYQEEYDDLVANPVEGRAMITPDSIDIDQIDEYFRDFNSNYWIDSITLEGPINA